MVSFPASPNLVASLPPYILFSKPFSCNIYVALSYVLQTTDLRQTYVPTKPFSCNTYENHGGRVVSGPSMFQRFIRASSTYLLSFHILAHSLARRKTQPFCFQAIPRSLPKTPGVGVSHIPFIQTITCPEGVHRTYYWRWEFAPPSYSQVTVPSFPSTFIYVGGCDG